MGGVGQCTGVTAERDLPLNVAKFSLWDTEDTVSLSTGKRHQVAAAGPIETKWKMLPVGFASK